MPVPLIKLRKRETPDRIKANVEDAESLLAVSIQLRLISVPGETVQPVQLLPIARGLSKTSTL